MSRSSSASALALTSAALMLAAAPAQAQFYNLAGTGVQAIYGLSADGTRGVGYGTSYYTWTPLGTANIGGTFSGGAPKISDNGATALITALNPASGLREMTRYDWATGTTTPLGSLGSSSGGEASSGWGLSGDGNVAVGFGWVTAGAGHAMTVTGTNPPVSLGTTVVGRSTRADSTNFNGTTVVGYQDASTGFRQGAAWINGVQRLVTDSNGNLMGGLADVTGDGQWAVGSGVSSNGFQAYRWSPVTGYSSLGPSLLATDRAGATAISDDGKVIVGFSRANGPAQFGRGFIWTEATGMLNLTTYANSVGVNTGGITLALPLAISADGKTIGGLGSNGAGWVLTLPVTPVPEPGSLALMGLGVAALLAIRRRTTRA